jgi:hypothetical protein
MLLPIAVRSITTGWTVIGQAGLAGITAAPARAVASANFFQNRIVLGLPFVFSINSLR